MFRSFHRERGIGRRSSSRGGPAPGALHLLAPGAAAQLDSGRPSPRPGIPPFVTGVKMAARPPTGGLRRTRFPRSGRGSRAFPLSGPSVSTPGTRSRRPFESESKQRRRPNRPARRRGTVRRGGGPKAVPDGSPSEFRAASAHLSFARLRRGRWHRSRRQALHPRRELRDLTVERAGGRSRDLRGMNPVHALESARILPGMTVVLEQPVRAPRAPPPR